MAARLIAAAALAVCCARAQENPPTPPWWKSAWSARILFEVPATPGPAVAMDLPTAALARPDGADLRVVTLGGEEVPLRLVHMGPGDRALLCFSAAPFRFGSKRGYVYLGNPQNRRFAAPWKGRHGVILEVRRLVAARVENPVQMQRALERSSEVLGRAFVDRVFQGMNPFGPEKRCLSIYDGFFNVRRAGDHTLSVNAADATLLSVDGRVAISWLGWHRPEYRSSKKHSAVLKLSKGVHSFHLLNATRSRGVLCSLGVKAPGAKRLFLAPPNAYVRWTRPHLLALETREGGRRPWFTWSRRGDLGLSGRPVTCLALRDRSAIPAEQRRGDFWDFGDGTTSRQREPVHVFLEGGVFEITHTIFTRDGRRHSLAQKVAVQPSGTIGSRVWNDVKSYAEILAGYNPARLSPHALANAVFVLRAAEKFEQALPFLGALVEKAGDLDDPALAEEAFFFVDELRDRRHEYQRALKILETIATKSLSSDRRLRALALMAEILYDYLGDIPRASACVEKVLRLSRGGGGQPLRFALIKKADLLLEAGDRAGARALLQRAAAMARGRSFLGVEEVSAGEHMVAYEEYSGRKEYTAALRELRQWEWDAPLDKLSGLLRYLRADLWVCLGRPREALAEIARLEKADPESPDLPAALIMASQCHLALGEKQAARAALERILAEFPVAGARAEAEKRLQALGAGK